MNTPNDRSADEHALHNLFQELQDGWNRGDGQAYAASFTEDADYIVWNGTALKGRQAIAAAHQQLFETRFQGSRLEGFIQHIRFLSDDIALVHLHGRPQIPGQALPAPEEYSIQTLVAIRQADGWCGTAFQNTLMQPGFGQ
ncbi:MAG TPA: SgcJ/EcaC family oxidoreductase [Ktedonobacteraceae bacterium]|nr:SgcJ/EcaC family oxidoreductase [Ktedonobacteraceae bacterium]